MKKAYLSLSKKKKKKKKEKEKKEEEEEVPQHITYHHQTSHKYIFSLSLKVSLVIKSLSNYYFSL